MRKSTILFLASLLAGSTALALDVPPQCRIDPVMLAMPSARGLEMFCAGALDETRWRNANGVAEGYFELAVDLDTYITGEIRDGSPAGLWELALANGQPIMRVEFRNGLLHGRWQRWSVQTGALEGAGWFENGVFDGEWVDRDLNSGERHFAGFDGGRVLFWRRE